MKWYIASMFSIQGTEAFGSPEECAYRAGLGTPRPTDEIVNGWRTWKADFAVMATGMWTGPRGFTIYEIEADTAFDAVHLYTDYHVEMETKRQAEKQARIEAKRHKLRDHGPITLVTTLRHEEYEGVYIEGLTSEIIAIVGDDDDCDFGRARITIELLPSEIESDTDDDER